MKVKTGHTVKVHYKGTLTDGTTFDNSYARGTPIDFEVGSRKLIKGFSEAVLGMKKGETRQVTIPTEEAYGPVNPDAFQPVPRAAFSAEHEFEIGGTVQGEGPRGKFLARVHDIIEEEDTIVLDMNHPLAGEALTFEIEVLEVHKQKKQKTSEAPTPPANENS
jgi:peptidylprolyl isomerase